MKTNKKRNIKLEKIKVSKLNGQSKTAVKGGNADIEGCSNVGGLLSLINGSDGGCVYLND